MIEIPIISPEAINRIDTYFNAMKIVSPLSKEEHQKWRLLKKAIPILYKPDMFPKPSEEEVWASVAIASIEKIGICEDIMTQLIIEKP